MARSNANKALVLEWCLQSTQFAPPFAKGSMVPISQPTEARGWRYEWSENCVPLKTLWLFEQAKMKYCAQTHNYHAQGLTQDGNHLKIERFPRTFPSNPKRLR
jgi:hypothetical protein